MKKLQNNFTTPEQSKRLLELGVPADSADGYYTNFNDGSHAYCPNYIYQRDKEWWDAADVTASWSVGRLIEIASICCTKTNPIEFWWDDTPMDDILFEFDNEMDFSKLED